MKIFQERRLKLVRYNIALSSTLSALYLDFCFIVFYIAFSLRKQKWAIILKAILLNLTVSIKLIGFLFWPIKMFQVLLRVIPCNIVWFEVQLLYFLTAFWRKLIVIGRNYIIHGHIVGERLRCVNVQNSWGGRIHFV